MDCRGMSLRSLIDWMMLMVYRILRRRTAERPCKQWLVERACWRLLCWDPWAVQMVGSQRCRSTGFALSSIYWQWPLVLSQAMNLANLETLNSNDRASTKCAVTMRCCHCVMNSELCGSSSLKTYCVGEHQNQWRSALVIERSDRAANREAAGKRVATAHLLNAPHYQSLWVRRSWDSYRVRRVSLRLSVHIWYGSIGSSWNLGWASSLAHLSCVRIFVQSFCQHHPPLSADRKNIEIC